MPGDQGTGARSARPGRGARRRAAAAGRRALRHRRGDKVFFSITVDAAVVQAGRRCAKRRRGGRQGDPGVQSAMVALTAERKGGAAAPRPPQQAAAAATRAAGPAMGLASSGSPFGRDLDHRGRVGQRRRRKIHHGGQFGFGFRDLGMTVGILDLTLRAVAAKSLAIPREAADTSAAPAQADLAATPHRDVDRLSDEERRR